MPTKCPYWRPIKEKYLKRTKPLQEVTSKIIDGKRNDNCYTYFVDYILL